MNLPASYISKVFKMHGEFCASQPWEVIVCVSILLASSVSVCSNPMASISAIMNNMESLGVKERSRHANLATSNKEWFPAVLLLMMTVLAILRLTHSFCKIGPSIIWKTSFCYFFFTNSLCSFVMWSVNCQPLQAWLLLPLLIDIQNVTRMAQFTLSSSHLNRMRENLVNAMYILAPALTLDTLTNVLLISLGFLSPIPQLQLYALHATVLVLINWLVYMSFYPSGLALFLQLMNWADGGPSWNVQQVIDTLAHEGQRPSVHRIKILVAALILTVHLFYQTNTLDGQNMSNEPSLVISNWAMLIIALLILFLTAKHLYHDETLEQHRIFIAQLTRKFAKDNPADNGITNRSYTGNNRSNENSSNGDNLAQFSNFTNEDNSSYVAKTIAKRNSGSSMRRRNDGSFRDSSTVQTRNDAQPRGMSARFYDNDEKEAKSEKESRPPRSLHTCVTLSKHVDGVLSLSDSELAMLVECKVIRSHTLEKVLQGDHIRAVRVRRRVVEHESGKRLQHVPFDNYHYDAVMGACCENVIGYMPIPIGIVGPLVVDGHSYLVPMATTEGCLVASVNRGCTALYRAGVSSVLIDDSMTRAPVVHFDTLEELKEALNWLRDNENFQELKTVFDKTSRFARLKRIEPRVAGRDLYLRFVASTGDAMGMNMVSKASEQALTKMKLSFPHMKVLGLSGNVCTDKKASAINWIQGRGKSVVCEALLSANVVESVLKTSPAAMVALNEAKNLIGSSLAASIGGNNAQAANVVTAIFIATGQDVAQNVCSSQCLTQMSVVNAGDLSITCTMPSIEVGTIGGGTTLPAQANCLEMMGVRGPNAAHPGNNARQLAKVICATVLAGELSLMAALVTGDLVVSHLRHNRSNLAQVLSKQQQ